MAAAKTWLLKSVVFTKSGGSAVPITGLQSISYRKGGQVVTHHTDALVAVSAHFMDAIEGGVTVRTTDASFLANTGLQPGDVGSLVITYQQRAKGTSAVAGQDKTITAAQAMVGEHSGDLPQTGQSGLEVPFHCSDDNGSSPFAFG